MCLLACHLRTPFACLPSQVVSLQETLLGGPPLLTRLWTTLQALNTAAVKTKRVCKLADKHTDEIPPSHPSSHTSAAPISTSASSGSTTAAHTVPGTSGTAAEPQTHGSGLMPLPPPPPPLPAVTEATLSSISLADMSALGDVGGGTGLTPVYSLEASALHDITTGSRGAGSSLQAKQRGWAPAGPEEKVQDPHPPTAAAAAVAGSSSSAAGALDAAGRGQAAESAVPAAAEESAVRMSVGHVEVVPHAVAALSQQAPAWQVGCKMFVLHADNDLANGFPQIVSILHA